MDVFLDYFDPVILDSIYDWTRVSSELHFCSDRSFDWNVQDWVCKTVSDPTVWERDSPVRQIISLFFITWLSSSLSLLIFGAICYYWNFDRSLKKHPKYHRNQIRHEIKDSLLALLGLNVWTAPIFLAQVRGYSKLYDYKLGDGGLGYEVAQFVFFVLFSDTCMYWLHRMFHLPFLFNLMHKKHHRYIIPTPFSAYAFDPVEAYIMSLPIYAYSFIWPMSKVAQLAVFFYTNIWTFLLHDNRDQFHTVHHKNTRHNFGQYLTLWDHLGGTYIDPVKFFQGAKDPK